MASHLGNLILPDNLGGNGDDLSHPFLHRHQWANASRSRRLSATSFAAIHGLPQLMALQHCYLPLVVNIVANMFVLPFCPTSFSICWPNGCINATRAVAVMRICKPWAVTTGMALK